MCRREIDSYFAAETQKFVRAKKFKGFVVHLVLRQPIGPTEEASMRAQFTALFGPDMRVDIVRADSLPRTASGKFRYVESRVAQPILERLMGAASNQGAPPK